MTSNQRTEVRIASIGNVDSGKSTTISVLTHSILDDGKGGARKHILKHPHEIKSGRTSSISHSFVKRGDAIFTFLDLAGHEKYIKTTVSGLSGYFVEYAMITIGADRGIIGTTKEHLIVAMSLNIPIFIVITKIDVAMKNKVDRIEARLAQMFKNKFAGCKELKYITTANVDNFVQTYQSSHSIVPVFKISNISGKNVDSLKQFVFNLKPIKKIGDIHNPNAKFIIESRFRLPGIGLVVTGTVQDGIFNKHKHYYIGPFGKEFKKVSIRSIHDNFKTDIDILRSGEGGCFNIKFIDSKEKFNINQLRKGHIIVASPYTVRQFEANIKILHHPTTIKLNYEPTVHCGIVRQSAKICKMDRPLVRTGDIAKVTFEFKYHPEYIRSGDTITFREGRTKGVGTITKIINRLVYKTNNTGHY